MGFWGIFWLWAALILSSLILFALIGLSLFHRLAAAAHQAKRIAERLEKLTNLMEKKPILSRGSDSILADPAGLQLRRRALIKAKVKKQEKRRRRLIASLKRFDSKESRFN